jgi:hypothetical protein
MLENDLWERRKIFRKWIKAQGWRLVFDKFGVRSHAARD